MLKVNDELNVKNESDNQIIEAFRNCINLYQDHDLVTFWNEIKSSKFLNHHFGKSGNHIWISRKEDNNRVATITE